jgi:DNA-binding transcriptional regulator YiaG
MITECTRVVELKKKVIAEMSESGDATLVERARMLANTATTEGDDDDEIPELGEEFWARAIRGRLRERLITGDIHPGSDIAAIRRFAGLTEDQFAAAMAIDVSLLREWDRGTSTPDSAAIVALTTAIRSPSNFRKARLQRG